MSNSAFAAGERRYLTEPEPDVCPRCGEDNGGDFGLCPECSDEEHDAQQGSIPEEQPQHGRSPYP